MLNIENWDPTKTYSVGDVVLFLNKVYVAADTSTGIIPTPCINFNSPISDYRVVCSNENSLRYLSESIFPGERPYDHFNYNYAKWRESE